MHGIMRFYCGLVAALALGLGPARVHAQPRLAVPISSEPQYFAPPFLPGAPAWTAADEAWYRRNRGFAAVGKVLTLAGLVTSLAGFVPTGSVVILASGIGAQYTGQIIWGAADLKGAKQMQRRGFRITRVPGILALCGAFVFSPLLWVAGPIQSARLREAHAWVMRPQLQPRFGSMYGIATRVAF